MRPAIQVRIGPDGRVLVKTIGFTGESCLDVVPAVEDLVAARVVASEYLPEFFAAAATTSEDAVADDTRDDVGHVTDREAP